MIKANFLLILMPLLLGCVKPAEDVSKYSCQENDPVKFYHLWSKQMESHYDYNKTKWFDMGNSIAIIYDKVVEVVDKKSSKVLFENLLLGELSFIEDYHSFKDMIFYRNSFGVIRYKTSNGHQKNIFHHRGIQSMIGNEHMLVVLLGDSEGSYEKIVMIDVELDEMVELQSIVYSDHDRATTQLIHLYKDSFNKFHLYYNQTPAQGGQESFLRMDLATKTKDHLNNFFAGEVFEKDFELYSMKSDPDDTRYIRHDPLSLAPLFQIRLKLNNPSSVNGNFSVRTDEIIFYNEYEVLSFDKSNGESKWHKKDPKLTSLYANRETILIKDYIFFLYDKTNTFGLFDIRDQSGPILYCESPAALNRITHFIDNDAIYVINFENRLEKHVLE